MSIPINCGGPAFPMPSVSWKEKGEDCVAIGTHGMTLRDYFAAQALAGQLAFSPSDPFKKYHQPEEVASACFRFADAMLKAREAKL